MIMINQKTPVLLFYVVILFLSISIASAQQQTLKGKVVNKNKQSVEFVHATLLKNDTIYVDGTATDSLGYFSFKAEKGNYRLILEQFGAEYFNNSLDLDHDLDIGAIEIDESISLNEIFIEKRKALIEKKVDRLVFNIENSISGSGGNGLDALKATPLLYIQDERITMIGKSNVGVMVNDRLISLSGEDLIVYLRSLRSDDISNIEIITSPPSNYDAAGNSGLINIITKRAPKINDTYGNIRAGLSQARHSLGNIGLSLNSKHNNWTFSGSVDYVNGSTKLTRNLDLEYPQNEWKESFVNRRYSDNLSGRLAADYQISEKSQTGIQYRISNDKPITSTKTNSLVYDRTTSDLDSIIKTPANTNSDGILHTMNWYYQTKLDTLGTKLSIDVDYLNQNTSLENTFHTQTFFAENLPSDNYLSARILGDKKIDIFTSKFDMDFPLKWINLSFGGKVSFIHNEHENNYYDTTNETPYIENSKSNAFEYNENIQALYFSANKRLTDKFSFKLGLRTENTQTNSYSRTLSQRNKNNYLEWFPSLFMNYQLKNNGQLAFNYNRRIDRPGYNHLNPFRYYTNANNYVEGNPFLKAYYTNNFEVSYFNKNYYTALFFRDTKNGIAQINFIDPETYIQAMTSENYYNQINYGWINAYSFRFKNVWENSTQVIISYTKTTSDISQIVPNVNSWNGHFNTRNSFILDSERKYRLELNYMYRLPAVSESYKTDVISDLSVGARANLLQNKVQFSLEFTDVFRTNKITYYQTVNGIPQKGQMYNDNQKLRFSLTYNFGKQFKTQNRKQSNEEEEKRL